MSRPLTVAVSQRIDVWSERGERRDALDHRLVRWLLKAECVAVPVPNVLTGSLVVGLDDDNRSLQLWLRVVKPDAILLSGGNDIGEAPERDNTEGMLLDYAKKQALPVLGICRGMQMMAIWSGGAIKPIAGHVLSRHRLRKVNSSGGWPEEVNSFHNFALTNCPQNFQVIAHSEDDAIEAIQHEELPWEGWMWHPERESPFNPMDLKRLKTLLDSRTAS